MTSGRCNNNCLFCCDRNAFDGTLKLSKRYLDAYNSPYLTPKGFMKESRKTDGVDSILFTGGEPTLNKDLLLFIKSARKSGYKNIGIQTNGRLLNCNNLIVKLLKNGVNELNISIHASNKKIHDALTRSAGSFDQTYKGLCSAVSLKSKYRFRVNTNCTITKLNYRDIADYIKMLQGFDGIDSLVLNTPMYTGNAKKFFKQLFIPYSAIAKEVKIAIDRLRGRTVLNIQLSPMPFCLMKGYECFVGRFEQPFEIQDGRSQAISRGTNQVKIKDCLLCRYCNFCSGIDVLYAKKIGWSEFSPVRGK